MILHALCAYYDALAARGEISPPGWCEAKVSFALDLDESGALRGLIPLKTVPEGGKKEVPQLLKVPAQQKRTVGILANFLCDSSSYFLGVDNKGKPARSLQCFEAARELHEQILSAVDSPAARAVLAFFAGWQPADARTHPALADQLDEIMAGANLVFSVGGLYAQNDPAIRAAWQAHALKQTSDSAVGRCLVTGETAPIARLHPSIKGVQGAQSSGASLVSFNAPAFESYGHEAADGTGQGLNSPVSEAAAFAYTTALNYLLRDRSHVKLIGDMTVVYWAADAEPMYQDIFNAALFGSQSDLMTQQDLDRIVGAISRCEPVDLGGIPLNPKNDFYILGLAPSAARLSVRFFLHNSFNGFLTNILAHEQRLSIVKPRYIQARTLSISQLLNETVNQNIKAKKPDSSMTSTLMRAILENTPYPASLFSSLLLRIDAERDITWKKAAILKAILLRNDPEKVQFKEAPIMPIEYSQEGPAFLLGCLFALLEKIQQEAIENIDRTLVDKYISTASASPAHVFDGLLEKSRYHLQKVHNRYRRLEDLTQLLAVYHAKSPAIPEHHDHFERANFMIGYYLKRQELWTSKEDLKKMEEKKNG